ncbi:hypothetical protein [Winogradskyella sp. 3972H.M.0a.05]|uniref:hypothetical protein n=1 Tax=Winogradskyella sp. 3972H.M.0a.05 TaxID=2950277 RepID=UPI00339B6C87
MKTRILFSLSLISFLCVFNCNSNEQEAGRLGGSSLEAAVSEDCSRAINFEDLDNNVYAYRADDIFFGAPSIQTGGHSDEEELTDLGANIFATNASGVDLVGDYAINGSIGPGTAYIFYFDGTGNQYISSANNTEVLTVSEIVFNEDTVTVERLVFTFNNVEVANVYDPEDVLCISAFELFYNN